MAKIKVLIIDDSALMRKYLSGVLIQSEDIEVVGAAIDPIIAVGKIKKFKPDVLTLDIQMPRMDGLTFLSKLMISHPMPVIMVSSLTAKGARETFKALEFGAIDFICKPSSENPADTENFERDIIEKVKSASKSKIKRRLSKKSEKEINNVDKVVPRKNIHEKKIRTDKIVATGASTGGVMVIENILLGIHEDSPGVVITQHMPPKFTYEFANRVNVNSRVYVKEAEDGDRIYRGTAFIAPGGKHLLLRCDSKSYFVELNDGPLVNGFKPSVDVLFRSVSQCAGGSGTGIICTGMGGDGANGLLEMKESGAFTIAQDEESCAVYGMPRQAVLIGAAQKQMNISGMINYIKKI